MKKLVHALVCVLTVGATVPVAAGPDWQIIEKARKDKQSSLAAHQNTTKPDAGKNCPPERLVLLLDHGPRALSTPYLNQIRRERHEAQIKACADAPR